MSEEDYELKNRRTTVALSVVAFFVVLAVYKAALWVWSWAF